jgi:single-strand DNA-binding protein
MIIGNLTRDPELKTTSNGYTVCNFTVAVNNTRRSNQNPGDGQSQGQDDAIFFRVRAWNRLAETCSQYLSKGRKVCVIGPVSASTYQANDGTTRVSLEVVANEVEFLSSRNEISPNYEPSVSMPVNPPVPVAMPSVPTPVQEQNQGFTQVETDDLPF